MTVVVSATNLTIYWNGQPITYPFNSSQLVKDLIKDFVGKYAPSEMSKLSSFGLSPFDDPSNYYDKSKTLVEAHITSSTQLILIESSYHEETTPDKTDSIWLALYTGVVFSVAIWLLFSIWPTTSAQMGSNVTRSVSLFIPLTSASVGSFAIGGETLIVLCVALGAVIGACVYSMYTIALHRGFYKDFDKSFTMWYMLRPLIGPGLALALYFLVVAGILGLGTSNNLSLVGVTGLSALVGLFTEQTMNKLNEVADHLFGEGPQSQSGTTNATTSNAPAKQ